MAPSRGRGKARPARSEAGTANNRRSTRKTKDAAPDVYREMLADTVASDDHAELSDRPLKRRKVAGQNGVGDQGSAANNKGKQPATSPTAAASRPAVPSSSNRQSERQTIEASSDEDDDDDDDDESDLGFEDVNLDASAASSPAADDTDGIADISISIATPAKARRQEKAKRKGASLAEKARRLLVHKSHLLCLLGHCIYVNAWCNNEVARRNLRGVLPAKVKSQLAPTPQASQFDRNRLFLEGLQAATNEFRSRFEVSASGMRKARWASEDDEGPLHADTEPMDRSDFIRASKRLQGSQDTGNQLFCALLRSIGVEARLVCSLQVLPFTSINTKATPTKPVKRVIYASDAVSERSNLSDGIASDTALPSSRTLGRIPAARRRLGQPSYTNPSIPAPHPPPERKRPIQKLAYPVFWTEVFNSAHQKWIPVDPIVTGTCNKPTKLEPPSAYPLNQLTYVLAFESDGSARDVTRRYAKAYNAKTRRHRVEATENGSLWLKKALRIFRRRGPKLDREQVEDAELAQKEAREGLPANVQDFKDHPYYALERHLRRHEVIHPRREVGKVNARTAKNPRMETVFRRQDVQICRSAEKWYRFGRVIKVGEQPLKHVPKRRGLLRRTEDDDQNAEQEETPLYAAFQTDLYIPPAVVRGRIPRNAFGNLDIYVPSMVPAGGVHIRHPKASEAAKILGVDFVDAVTGFSFKGRQGTAVIEGGVIAAGFEDAVRAVCEGLEWEDVLERCRARSRVALAMWGRLVRAGRVRERVRGEYGKGGGGVGQVMEGEEGPAPWLAAAEGEGEEDLVTAGQYSLVELMEMRRMPKKRKAGKRYERDGDDEDDVAETSETNATPAPCRVRGTQSRIHVGDDGSDDGDEWMSDAGTEDADGYGAGGFLAEDVDPTATSNRPMRRLKRKKVIDDASEDEEEGMRGEPAQSEWDEGGGFSVEDNDLGGGFVPEGEHGSGEGGGFWVDDRGEDEGHGGGAGGGGGGFLADDDQDDGGKNSGGSVVDGGGVSTNDRDREAQDEAVKHDYEASLAGNHRGDDRFIPEYADERPVAAGRRTDAVDEGRSSRMRVDRQQNNAAEPSSTPVEEAASEAGESDPGSLLSHDPEDEDAEPDWLESD